MNNKRKPRGYWTFERCKEEALKYKTKSEFKKYSYSTYTISLKNKWLNKICKHMITKRKPNGYWTFERCKEIALLYRTRKEFKEKSVSAHDIAERNGWLNEICQHMIRLQNKKNIWNKNKCKEKALLCQTRNEFRKKYSTAYNAARKNKWLNEICSHMIEIQKPHKYWAFNKIKELAMTCNTKKEFKEKSSAAYTIMLKNKWTNKICSHMKNLWEKKWTFEKCKEKALKYNIKSEFRKNYEGAYDAAFRNDWLNEICSHMILMGNKNKRLIYAFEFSDNYVYIGLTFNSEKRKYQHLDLNTKKISPVAKHIIKTGLQPEYKELTNYIEVSEAQKMEEYYVNKYKNNNWNLLNRYKTGAIGGNNKKWYYETCKLEASKYKSRSEFQKKSNTAYNVAYKNKWLDKICQHMKILWRKKWNYENCKIEALKHNSRSEFNKKASGAYDTAYNNKWLDEFFPKK